MKSFCIIPEKTNLVDKFSIEDVYVQSISNSPGSILWIENLQINKMGFPLGKNSWVIHLNL